MLAEFAYNNAKYSTIGISPFYVYYGFHLRLKYEVKANNSSFVLTASKKIKRIFFKREALVKC